jgi:hypothetical protein
MIHSYIAWDQKKSREGLYKEYKYFELGIITYKADPLLLYRDCNSNTTFLFISSIPANGNFQKSELSEGRGKQGMYRIARMRGCIIN